MWKKIFLVACCLALFVGARFAFAQDKKALVSTKEGSVLGMHSAGNVVFRGIPYAQAPTGKLRWAKPLPPLKRDNVLNAKEFSPICPQKRRNKNQTISEDCLYLNITTPDVEPNKPLPVMVWIHGGGFIFGSGSHPIYQSDVLSQQGVVLVTINYRIGALGFFAHPLLNPEDTQSTTNFGLLDMVAALEWVKHNISAFGGDKNNVTIFGESAGAMAVQMLMVSPKSKGLFSRAIAQSGYGTFPLPKIERLSVGADQERVEKTSAEKISKSIAYKVLGKNASSLEELRKIDAQAFPNVIEGFYLPFIDGVSLPDTPGQLFNQGRQHPVPLLTGGNSDEGSAFPLSGWTFKDVQDVFKGKEENYQKIYNINFSKGNTEDVTRLWGDYRYLLSVHFLAKKMQTVNDNTYFYYFDHVPNTLASKVLGAPHAADLGLVFGTQGIYHRYDNTYDSRRDKVGILMREYWVNFAKSGNPNGKGLPYWPKYTGTADSIYYFGKNKQPEIEKLNNRLRFLEKFYLDSIGGSQD